MPKAAIILLLVYLFSQNAFDKIANEVETAFSENKSDKIEKFFGDKVYLEIGELAEGYFSPEQCAKILNGFLKKRATRFFRIKTKSQENGLGYIRGKFYYSENIKRISRDVFIALKKSGDNWQITQMTIK